MGILNADLVDETLRAEAVHTPVYGVPFFAKILFSYTRFVVPFGTFRFLKGSAARAAHARGVALEKYLYAASYTAMAAANATPHKIFKSLALNGEIYGEIAYDS